MSDKEAEIKRVKHEAENQLMKIPGVTGVGVGYQGAEGKEAGGLAIRVYISPRLALKKNIIPSKIIGIPTVVIERNFKLHEEMSE